MVGGLIKVTGLSVEEEAIELVAFSYSTILNLASCNCERNYF